MDQGPPKSVRAFGGSAIYSPLIVKDGLPVWLVRLVTRLVPKRAVVVPEVLAIYHNANSAVV